MKELFPKPSPGFYRKARTLPRCMLLLAGFFIFLTQVSAQTSLISSCPGNITTVNDPGQCGAVVNFAVVPVSGKNVTIIYSNQPGTMYKVGVTEVTATAYDDLGSSSVCKFTVTVADNEAPKFTNYQAVINVNAGKDSCGAKVSFANPTVTQNCIYVSKSFTYTGAPQTFTVPAGVNSVRVEMTGAEGGRSGTYDGYVYGYPGYGGLVEATIPVTPGEVLTYNLGGAGGNGSKTTPGLGGYNGGGNGGGVPNFYTGGGGGGASDIRRGAATINDRIVVAAGGGGTGYYGGGGAGGGLVGSNGSGRANKAFGGTQTAGGAGSYYSTSIGQAGSFGLGGNGGDKAQSGGGGAGWYGGGGGGNGDGAGGSSYAFAGSSNVLHTGGYQAGNGTVTFTWAPPTEFSRTSGLEPESVFPVGTTIDTFVAKDAAGNEALCTITVVVTDAQAPSIQVPANQVVSAENGACGATVAIGQAVTSDNCGVASVTNDAPADNHFPVGTTTINWTVTDVHGNVTTAAQTITVIDNQKPILTVPANQNYSSPKSFYTIPALVASDNCGIASVSYSISGTTNRTGNDRDASGGFNTGVSTITWTVTDIHGNVQTASITIDIKIPQSLVIKMDDVWAVAPYGTANTLYIGLGPASLTLRAKPTTGTPPYTYEWKKTGIATSLSKKDSLVVSAEGEYTVNITDFDGNTGSVTRQINMLDVRCGNNDEKIAVCHLPQGNPENSKTICVSKSALNSFLVNGSYVGNCSATRTSPIAVTEEQNSKVSIYPNPTTDKLNIRLSSAQGVKADVSLINESGMTVVKRSVAITATNQLLQLNLAKYTPGVYLLKVVTEKGVRTEKVILRR